MKTKIFTNKILLPTGEEFGYVRYIPMDDATIQNEPELPSADMNTIFDIMRKHKISSLKVRFNRTDF